MQIYKFDLRINDIIHEVIIHYTVEGRIKPATRLDPPEYEYVEIHKVFLKDIDIFNGLDTELVEEIEIEIHTKIKENDQLDY